MQLLLYVFTQARVEIYKDKIASLSIYLEHFFNIPYATRT